MQGKAKTPDTGKIRGLLYCDCNIGIGKLKDSVNFLQSAIEYFRKYTIE